MSDTLSFIHRVKSEFDDTDTLEPNLMDKDLYKICKTVKADSPQFNSLSPELPILTSPFSCIPGRGVLRG